MAVEKKRLTVQLLGLLSLTNDQFISSNAYTSQTICTSSHLFKRHREMKLNSCIFCETN